jgi:hypothetical protein
VGTMGWAARRWQHWLPALLPAATAWWLIGRGGDLGSTAGLFALHLPVYLAHQWEEHLWPGGCFRQFVNRFVFRSGEEDFPASRGGVAVVNIGLVWLPIGLAAAFPTALRWVGLAWVGTSLVNALTHLAAALRLRRYNPGLVTALALLLPFSVWFFATRLASGELTAREVAWAIALGVALHVPVAALFVVPWLRPGKTERAGLPPSGPGYTGSG